MTARLNRLSYVDRATGEPIRRYEHPHPGALVHVDVKKLGNIPDGGGCVDKVTDGMVDDWCATVDALGDHDAIDADRVAYFGLSMGTRFGLPYVAAAARRLRCAVGPVLGKYGMRQPLTMPAAVDMAPRFALDAPTITVPVLFHVQWGDELFPRTGHSSCST
jgi:pimeloyl-ACP methyl ester carboxylesterase